MKIPKYYLNREYQLGEDTFSPWIEIRPIADYLLPEHKKEELDEARRFNLHKVVMCIIGTKWVIIPETYITERL
jgi:hypothetical protein